MDRPITLEQPVYLPGNERHGVWASPLLETVFGPELLLDQAVVLSHVRSVRVQGDMEMVAFMVAELRRSYAELPGRWIRRLAQQPSFRGLLVATGPDVSRASLEDQ